MKCDFLPGNLLRIWPANEDDPVDVAMKGEIVRFIRATESGHAQVSVGEQRNNQHSRKLYFRPQDLRKI